MRRIAAVAVSISLLCPSTAAAWGFDPHQFIVSRAIDLLPAQIRPFFEANRAFVVERSIDPDLWRAAGFTEEPPNHFLDLDAYGTYPFAALPRSYDDALKKYGREMLVRNGLLPWRTAEMSGRLIRAFQAMSKQGQYAPNDVKYFSAIIGHYAADAHVPFHAVLNYDGQLSGQHGVHARFETDLFARYRSRLAIAPGPLKTIGNERDYIFEVLLESTTLVPALLAADKEAIGDRDLYDDRYYDAFFAKTKPILERRLSESITAVASLIASAWEHAGRPTLPAAAPSRAPQRRRATAATP